MIRENEIKSSFPLSLEAREALFSDPTLIKKIMLSHMEVEEPVWFSSLSFALSSLDAQTLIVRLPHELFFRWYSSVGLSLVEKTAREVFGSYIDILYEWPDRKTSPARQDFSLQEKNAPQSFDTFIVGGKNKEALQLFRRFLQGKPGILLLHGPSGTGKSHLLMAAFLELQEKLYGRTAHFSCHELIELVQRDPQKARSQLLSCAAVLTDDIHLLESYPSVQKELASILDSIKKTFFIATYQTDSTDENGQKLHPALYDRLCSQLSLGLSEPDLDVRLRFAQDSMNRLSLPENRGTALFLARHCLRLRHISGVLEQIRLRYEQKASLPSENEISSLMGRAGSPQAVDTDSILAVVASHYGCTSSELCENTKERKLTLPRQIAMYLCRELLGESYPSLGAIFGGKDHSTVMYAIRKIEKLKVTNNDMNIQITELTKQCRNGLPRRRN